MSVHVGGLLNVWGGFLCPLAHDFFTKYPVDFSEPGLSWMDFLALSWAFLAICPGGFRLVSALSDVSLSSLDMFVPQDLLSCVSLSVW